MTKVDFSKMTWTPVAKWQNAGPSRARPRIYRNKMSGKQKGNPATTVTLPKNMVGDSTVFQLDTDQSGRFISLTFRPDVQHPRRATVQHGTVKAIIPNALVDLEPGARRELEIETTEDGKIIIDTSQFEKGRGKGREART